jgi:uncharacterized protein (DUF1800 family)
MEITRRDCLRGGAAAVAALALSGCRSIEEQVTAGWIDRPSLGVVGQSPELRLLQRATYGPASFDIARIAALGMAGWVDEQLQPETIDEPLVLQIRIESLRDILDADPGLLFDVDDHDAVRTLRQATILRAVYSRRQVYERMVGFWSDHFNIYAFKNEGPQYKIIDDRETIRPHALGRFRDLLGASAHSTAMIGYLDSSSNRKGVPNENYARELMELHTLGVNTGYTQRDVQNVARCFTGWTIATQFYRGRFKFDGSEHDDGVKHVLGHTILAGGGESDGEAVLDIVAAHPATAGHIARKLCLTFIGSVPAALHQRLAARFTSTGGQIAPVVRELLTSDELANAQPLIKRPFDFSIGAMRALGADTDGRGPIQDQLEALGQVPFGWPMPDGYPLRESAWLSGMIPRWKFASALATDQIAGTSVDWDAIGDRAKALGQDAPTACSEMLFGAPAANLSGVVQRLRQYGNGDLRQCSAIAQMSPEFQYK